MMPNWLMKTVQVLIAFSVSSAAIYWQWTNSGFLIAAWGGIAALGFTLCYVRVMDWRIDRQLQRSQKMPQIDDDERWL